MNTGSVKMNPLLLAIKIARRSPNVRHKTGAVIVNAKDEIVSVGWSHLSERRLTSVYSIHAEHHALSRIHSSDRVLTNCRIFVATITRHGNLTSGKPCKNCQYLIDKYGITEIIYTPAFEAE